MPSSRFAVAKIQPPRLRRARLQREALDAALARAVDEHRVVLLQAPAGYGKTSLIAARLDAAGDSTARAWVSLDADDDVERVFACLVAALEPHDLPWRTSPDALVGLAGQGPQPLGRATAALLNALADSGAARGLIVFDDLHRVRSEEVFVFLDRLLEHLPPTWTLLLSSRTAPPLALARLRAAGELAELGPEALRFSADEAQALLCGTAGAPPAASPAQAADLHERTAGWPAGLGLALVALRAIGGAGAASQATGAAGAAGAAGTRGAPAETVAARRIDRHLFDYLAAEVLDALPAPLHDFLLRVAVLPELTARRAAAVAADDRAAEWLDEIERRGLFATALDAQERTLVLHDLFRDALLARQALRLPHETPLLLRRAAAVEGDPLRRIGYRLRAGDWAEADADLDAAAPDLLLHGGDGEVLRLVEQFPPAQRSARLARLAATACGLRWNWIDMARWAEAGLARAQTAQDRAEVQRAQALLTHALYPLDRNDEVMALVEDLRGDDVAPDARRLALMADCSQCYRRGEHALLTARYAELLAMLQGCDDLLAWWQCVPPSNWTTIAGMPALIDRYVAAVLPRIGERPLPMRVEARMLRAFHALWSGRIEVARADLREAEQDMQWLALSGEAAWSVDILHMFLAAMSGDAATVQDRLARRIASHDDAPPEQRRFWVHQTAIYAVRLNGTLGGDPDDLRRWAALIRENPVEDPTTWNPRAWAVRARHAAATGQWAQAAEHFRLLLPKLHEMDVMGQRTDLTLRAGHVLLRLGRLDEAAGVVAPVLDRLLAEGVRGQALMCGPRVLAELAEAPWGDRLGPARAAELQAAARLSASLQAASAPAARRRPFGNEASGAGAAGGPGGSGQAPGADGADVAQAGQAAQSAEAPAAADDATSLSPREREVLARIAAGDRNKHIARALDISPHTVKRHVANILDKLGVASRGQAAAWHAARSGPGA